jgi:hypothetical protein
VKSKIRKIELVAVGLSLLVSLTAGAVPVQVLNNTVADGTITIGGGFTDWNGITAYNVDVSGDTTGAVDWAQVAVANDSSYLYFKWTFANPITIGSDAVNLLIDTDQNTASGVAIGGALGADVLVQGGTQWDAACTGACWSWTNATWMGLDAPNSGAANQFVGSEFELRIALTDLGLPDAINFVVSGNSVPNEDWYPNYPFPFTDTVGAGGTSCKVGGCEYFTYQLTRSVPEPGSLALLGSVLVALGVGAIARRVRVTA